MASTVCNGDRQGERESLKKLTEVDSLNGQATGDPLDSCTIWSYSIGHILNDSTAACWFTYLLLFLEKVLGESSIRAGTVMFSGQLADACATPIVGVLSDLTTGIPGLRLSPKKIWYIFGTILVLICFTGVFAYNPFQGHPEHSFIYLAVMASFFNVGWASVQVCHLAMVPELSQIDSERVQLVNLRYRFTILSNLSVFALFFFNTLGRPDMKYRILALTTLAVGFITSVIFIFGTKEKTEVIMFSARKSNRHRSTSVDSTSSGMGVGHYNSLNASTYKPKKFMWYQWFAVPDFYFVAVVYMGSRIVVNISQCYLQFYLLDTLRANDYSLSIVPFTLYISGFVSTFFIENINKNAGRQVAFAIGSFIVVIACLGFYLIHEKDSYLVYPAVVLLGLGSTAMMVTSQSMEHDLISDKMGTAAFVYGALSFTDKLSNGFLILGIQYLKEATCEHELGPTHECSQLIRSILVYVPTLSVLISLLATCCFSTHMTQQIHTTLVKYPSMVDPNRDMAEEANWHEWSEWVI